MTGASRITTTDGETTVLDPRLGLAIRGRSILVIEQERRRLSTLVAGLDPITPRYERRSDPGDATAALVWSASCFDDDFYEPDRGFHLLGDRLRLFDPSIPAPKGAGDSFWDDARFGIGDFTAEVMIRCERTAAVTEFFLDDGFFDVDLLEPDDTIRLDRVMDATVSSKALRDKLLIDFGTTRPLTLTDGIPLDGTFTFGAQTARTL